MPILGDFRIRVGYLIFPYLFKKRQLSFFRLSLFLRLLKKCIIHALHTKLPILGDFRIREGYPIFSDFFKKRESSYIWLSLFFRG